MEYKSDINFVKPMKARRARKFANFIGISESVEGFGTRKPRSKKTFEDEILEEIRMVCRQLEAVASQFEMECDNDLIDACIYEMEALRARYRYLIRHAKTTGVTLIMSAENITS